MNNNSTNNEVAAVILIIIIIIITGWDSQNCVNMHQQYGLCKDIHSMLIFESIAYQSEEYRDIELEYGEELSVPSEWEMDDVMTESLSVSISLSESSIDDNYDVIDISRDEYDNDEYQLYQSWTQYNHDDEYDDGYNDEYDDELSSEWEIDDNPSTDPFQSQQHNDNDINNDFEYPPWDEDDDEFDDEPEVNDVYQENPQHIELMVSQQQHINVYQDDGQFEYPPWNEYDDEEDDDDDGNDYDGFEYPPWPEYDQHGAEYEAIQDIEVNDVYQQEAININLMPSQQDSDIYEYPPWSEYDDHHSD